MVVSDGCCEWRLVGCEMEEGKLVGGAEVRGINKESVGTSRRE